MDVLTAASKRPRSRSLVLDYVLRRSTLEKILEITADPHEFVRIISSLCESLTRREDLELVRVLCIMLLPSRTPHSPNCANLIISRL